MDYLKAFAELLMPSQSSYCECKRTNGDYCTKIEILLKMSKTNVSFDRVKSKEIYENLLKVNEDTLLINKGNVVQIKKDLARTYPGYKMFRTPLFQKKLFNVLRAFSNYDREICYFQGMNFIVGFFLYHCEEYVAFWLFVSLQEDYGLRNLYREGFPGLKEHSEKVNEILVNKYKDINHLFQTCGVNLQILMVEWLYSLFSSLIPLELQMDFYMGFFTQGWKFFYKMCISSFLNLNGTFTDSGEIYIALKMGKNDDLNKETQIKNWKKLIGEAYQVDI